MSAPQTSPASPRYADQFCRAADLKFCSDSDAPAAARIRIGVRDDCNSRRGKVAYPKCEITLIAPKPTLKAYPERLLTVGDHIRKIRLDRDLSQTEVAKKLGITSDSLVNWELGHTEPHIRFWPKILQYLGYYPFPDEGTLQYKITRYRRYHGIQKSELARRIGLDPATIKRVENTKGGGSQNKSTTKKLNDFLEKAALTSL